MKSAQRIVGTYVYVASIQQILKLNIQMNDNIPSKLVRRDKNFLNNSQHLTTKVCRNPIFLSFQRSKPQKVKYFDVKSRLRVHTIIGAL